MIRSIESIRADWKTAGRHGVRIYNGNVLVPEDLLNQINAFYDTTPIIIGGLTPNAKNAAKLTASANAITAAGGRAGARADLTVTIVERTKQVAETIETAAAIATLSVGAVQAFKAGGKKLAQYVVANAVAIGGGQLVAAGLSDVAKKVGVSEESLQLGMLAFSIIIARRRADKKPKQAPVEEPKFDPNNPAVLPTPDDLPKGKMPALSDNGYGQPYGTPAPAKVPNPYGKLGSPAHRAKVQDVVADIEARGLRAQQEVAVKTVNGEKDVRFMDVVAIDPKTNRIVEVHQVGRTLKSDPMVPVARERAALRDVRHTPELRDAKRIFHDY